MVQVVEPNSPGVEGEQPHQQNDITTAEEDVENFTFALLGSNSLLVHNQPETEGKHDDRMSTVTKHDSEQEGKCYDGVQGCNLYRVSIKYGNYLSEKCVL